jgi:gliding motility-associated-like protein
MKFKFHLAIVFFAMMFSFNASAQIQQIQLFNENWEFGSGAWTLNGNGVGSPAGTNKFIVNNSYLGLPAYPNNSDQSQTYGGQISFAPNSQYLHIHDEVTAQGQAIDNSNYNPNVASDRIALMNSGFCTMGITNVVFSFFYMCDGTANAYGEIYYSKNNGPWIQCGQPKYSGRYMWKYEAISDPAFDNVNDIRFGFRWVNDAGTPPVPGFESAFSVDDINVIGDYDPINHAPVDITITNLSTDTVCRDHYLSIFFQLSDTLCDGTYEVELSDPMGNFNNPTNLGVFSIYYPTTTSGVTVHIPINIPIPAGNCYKVRINRISPAPVLVGIASVCFTIVDCPNVIVTKKPVVLNDTNAICINSVIDIPFTSTGIYTNNVYIAQLSDVNGNFGVNPTVVGTSVDNTAYDPALGIPPGNVSGKIPVVPPGCNYYLRIVSTSPYTIGSLYGPFCIRECDAETNLTEDIHVCLIPNNQGWDTLVTIDVDHFVNGVQQYLPGNEFKLEVLSKLTFAPVGALGALGSVTAVNDTLLHIVIPDLANLLALGIAPKGYYARVVATMATDPDNTLGTLIRLTIGAPADAGVTIESYILPSYMQEDTFCVGDIAALFFQPYNSDSKYQWTCNGINNGAPFTSPSGFNSLYVNLGGQGNLTFSVQENNFGCLGPWSPIKTIVVDGPPAVNITGPSTVCLGDTNHYKVPFGVNTYYGWTVPNNGTIVDTAANEIDAIFSQVGTYQIKVTAINHCGTGSGVKNVTVKPYPVMIPLRDTTICEGEPITFAANTGVNYLYSWSDGGAAFSNLNNISVNANETHTFYLSVTSPGGCKTTDTVTVTVQKKDMLEKNDSICPDKKALLDAGYEGQGATYLWGDGSTAQTREVGDSGTYTVFVYLPGQACPKMLNFAVDNIVCEPSIEFPNVFTPQGDGSNDKYHAFVKGKFDEFYVKIYNRWGNEVYTSTDAYFGWDGTNKNGKICSDGTYYWVAYGKYQALEYNFSGFLTLIK